MCPHRENIIYRLLGRYRRNKRMYIQSLSLFLDCLFTCWFPLEKRKHCFHVPVCRIVHYSSSIEKDKHVTLFLLTGSSDGHQSKAAGRWEGCKSFYATRINIYLSSGATRKGMKDHLIALSLFSDGFFFSTIKHNIYYCRQYQIYYTYIGIVFFMS